MIEVKTQKQLDVALKKTNNGADDEIHIVGGEGLVIGDSAQISSVSGSAQISSVYGSAQISYVYDSAQISSVYGSAQISCVCGSAQIRSVCGSAQISSVCDSAQISYVCDSAQISYVCGSAQIRYVSGNATVHVHSNNVTGTAEESAVIRVHCTKTKIKGGTQLKAAEPKPATMTEAIKRWGMKPVRGKITLFKAVCKDLKSERGFHYPIGETVSATDWHDRAECGGGLHLSPTVMDARRCFEASTRWLEVEVAVKDLALCSVHESVPDKCKARKLKVVREVDRWGKPV